MTNEWKFTTDNVKRLRDRLEAADAAVYNLDPHTINWDLHCEDFIKGIRKYLLRESDEGLPNEEVLIERLLWTCPEISRLHLLIRHKRDVRPDTRLKELQQSQVFDVIKQKCPERLEKLSMVAGDITKENFGMDRESFEKLNQVSVVFHSAATVKFDELLNIAVDQNLRSVLTLMNICDKMPLMQVLVYVSTAYSNAELSSVEERVYPPPIHLQQFLALIDNLPVNLLASITPKLISPKPNTYTFTKAMAESALADRAYSAPYAVAIFRSSIITPSLRHPFPGWIENFNGPCGLVMGVGKGLMHVLLCEGQKRGDLIPVDIAVDTLIAVAWETGIENSREVRVYNCSSYDNPTTWDEFRVRLMRGIRHHPFDAPLWYPSCFFIKSRLVLAVTWWVLHTAPLHTIDFLYATFGIKQRLKMSTVNRRMRAGHETLRYFMTNEWKFSTDNVKRLRDRLEAVDAAVYNLDPHTINWDIHCEDFVKGTRKYLLRESDHGLQKAQSRIQKLYVLHRLCQCLMAYITWRIAVKSTAAVLRIIAALIRFKKDKRNLIT